MMRSRDFQDILAQIALHDDQRAYKELFKAFYSSLYQFALSYVKSGDQADEIVSDVFIKIWKKRTGLTRIRNIRLYLFVSTKNTALSYLRKQNKPALQADYYRIRLQSVYFDPEKLMLTEEMIQRIQEAIRRLPPRCQLIFKLVKEDGLKYREVATLLHLSIKTVENQMATAFRQIGKAIQFDIRTTLPSGR